MALSVVTVVSCYQGWAEDLVRCAECKSRATGRRDEAKCTWVVWAVSGPAASVDNHHESQYSDVSWCPCKFVTVHRIIVGILLRTMPLGYETNILQCWSKAWVNWEGCDSKGIWHIISGVTHSCNIVCAVPASGFNDRIDMALEG